MSSTVKAKTKGYASKLQRNLPLVLSCLALGVSGFGELRRHEEAKSTYNQGRIELFRQMTRNANNEEVQRIYTEVFPRDSIDLGKERDYVNALKAGK